MSETKMPGIESVAAKVEPSVDAGMNREVQTELTQEFVTATAERLVERIDVRFGNGELKRIATIVASYARHSRVRLRKPYRAGLLVKLIVWPVVVAVLGGLGFWLYKLNLKMEVANAGEFVQGMDALLETLVMLAAASWFFLTLGRRIVRSQLTKAVQELRALAHTVDLVQLDKDPDRLNWQQADQTPKSPTLGKANTAFLLGRYLDYCAELLSLIGKIGALYSEQVTDAGVLNELTELEKLTNQYRDNIGTKISSISSVSQRK